MEKIFRVFYAKRVPDHVPRAVCCPDGWEVVKVQTVPLEDGTMGFTLFCKNKENNPNGV